MFFVVVLKTVTYRSFLLNVQNKEFVTIHLPYALAAVT